jgi:YcaO-like protein with predicted kinase domain
MRQAPNLLAFVAGRKLNYLLSSDRESGWPTPGRLDRLAIRGPDEVGVTTKSYSLDDDRPVPPQETISRVKRFAAAFGITRVANLTGLDRTGIAVVMVCRPNARSSAVFNGKGIDLDSAQASALMEAAETWHAENIRLPLQFASFADLGGRQAVVDIDALPRAPPGTQFDPYLPILWVEGRNLMDGSAIWVPFEIVHADSRMRGPPMTGCFSMSTNGLASGNHFLEAVSHAICEIIERDATSLWHRSPPAEQDRRRLDLASIDDAKSLAILDLLARARLDVGVWDITTDVGVCAFQCLIVERAGETGHIGVGAACHPARATALRRAVLEAAQVRTTYIIGSREDIEPVDYDPAVLRNRTAEAHALMRSTERARDFRSAPSMTCETPAAEVAWLLDRLRAVGLKQAIAVDLTQPEFGIPVVRVVVPGLEGSDHHHSQYWPGPRARAAQVRRS